MKRNLLFTFNVSLVALFLTFCFSGCVFVNLTDPGAVTPKGNQEIYEFNVGEFNRIRIEGYCDTHYHSAPSNTVTLAVQPNLREYYIVEVINGELVVRTTRRINFRSNNAPVLTISTPVLNRITMEGAGAFTAHDRITADSFDYILTGAGDGRAELDVNRLFVEISGAGDLKLSGRADIANIVLEGAGDLSALELQTRDTTINLSGVGSISISCSENLRINADGVGSIAYRGSPSIDLRRSGIVSITQVN